MNKDLNAYKTIGEVAKILGLNSQKRKMIQTHTIRYWEKEFKQIKPKILNGKRRYYDTKNIELLKKVHFLLKEQGMTINGVKIGDPAGIVTAASATGIVTYYGDGSYLTGAAPGLSAAIGISSGGTQIGSGVTMIDFTATNATITATPTVSGVSTVNIQPSVSLGLVIALGG